MFNCVQVVSREEKPYYEITAGDHPDYVAPEDVAKLIFNKMKGNLNETHTHASRMNGELIDCSCFLRDGSVSSGF